MSPELVVLLGTALTLGVTHTAIGIDHTLPFIVLGKARQWSLGKALWVTAGCGLAHVLSSVAVGAMGWVLGSSSAELQNFEASRGELAAWALIAFGALYAALGLWRMHRGDGHRHLHVHADGTIHSHPHAHVYVDGGVVHEHSHRADDQAFSGRGPGRSNSASVAALFPRRVWPALFVVFFLGPCEALVPLMFGSALLEAGAAWWVAATFGAATVSTMLALVTLGYLGLSAKALSRFEPHMNWIAGLAIAFSGVGVQLGL